MLSDDQLGEALHREFHAMGSDIVPSEDLMRRLLADDPPQPRRRPAIRRRGRSAQESSRLIQRRLRISRFRHHGGRRSAPPRLTGALTLTAVIVALIVALVVVVTAGGGPSIVARAYAATSTNGVIVHYIQTLQFRRSSGKSQTAVHDVWASGRQRHLIVTGNDPKQTDEIAFNGREVQNYFPDGTLATYRVAARTLARGCGSIGILLGECFRSDQINPLTALRRLYRSGRLHAAGQTTLGGRSVDLITGSAQAGRLRALVDPRTFVPIEIQLVQQLPRPPGFSAVQLTTTVTDYQRLPLTPHNRHLLVMRGHPHARVVHLCVDGSSCSASRP